MMGLSDNLFMRKGIFSSAYNFADYLPKRKVMMQKWADYLDELKANV